MTRRLAAACLAALACAAGALGAEVTVTRTGGGAVLERDGEPYFVRGVGGATGLEELARIGGNSFRTWGAQQLDETRVGDDGVERPLLDHAHQLGLTVAAGFWMGHPRAGFDYGDEDAVRAQLDELRSWVERHKDHPAILLWGIGNEVEIGGADREQVFRALNDAARLVKSIDPDHPTMVVLAEIGDGKAEDFERWCPDVDILGVNSYAGIVTLDERLRAAGVTRPYIVAEYGVVGHWEAEKTAWGVPYEPTSTEKAEFLARAHRDRIAGSDTCLGGYAFLWGRKQETTGTWFGMFLEDGRPLGAVETLESEWLGDEARPARAPRLAGGIEPAFDYRRVAPDADLRAAVRATDPRGRELTYTWSVLAEATDLRIGGDAEEAPPTVDGAVTDGSGSTVAFHAPREPGAYRLFVTVSNGSEAATANLPFLVVEER